MMDGNGVNPSVEDTRKVVNLNYLENQLCEKPKRRVGTLAGVYNYTYVCVART